MLNKIQTKLSSQDKKILTAYEDITEGIAAFLGSYCEVALHSLEDPERALIKIANAHHTNRKLGAALTEHGAQIVHDYKETKKQDRTCYTTSSETGQPMRSLFTVITNGDKPIGLLGINFNMNIPLSEFISTFSLFCQFPPQNTGQQDQLTPNSVEDLIHNAVSEMVTNISTNINIPNHEKNKYIVYGLHEKGIFEIKGSVLLVAKELKLSKYTIYSYIRELKENSSS